MDLVTGAIGSIISKLAELLQAEFKLQEGVKKHIESLTRELASAHAFLQEIDKVPPDQINGQVKIWASEVREASYDMEDILDTFFVRVKDPRSVSKRYLKRLKDKMGSLFHKPMKKKIIKKKKLVKRLHEKMSSLFVKIKARHDIAHAIDEVNKKLKEIAERRCRYQLDNRVASPASSSFIDPRIALVHGTKMSMLVDMDEPKDAVIKMLSHDDMSTTVVSLLGVGGVGKTTLAKAIYDELKENYECGAFVSVGRNPNLEKVLRDIFFDIDKFNDSLPSRQRVANYLITELLKFLQDKRYLIVIDDVWETQSRKRITEALAQNNFGSRIIITTRNSGVAIGEVYKVQPLSDDNSRKLFYARIFGGEDKCPDNQREKVSEVAQKILRKCGGLPLAIITMASLLLGKSMEEWVDVGNSTRFCDKYKEQLDDIMWILSLSYYDLPSHLKTCLLYLSVFPEDHFIKKDSLIWMWIAEGFVHGKPGSLIEIGEGYFNDLVNRSLIQPVEDEERMIIYGCRVHDMIHDLILSLSREADFAVAIVDTNENFFTKRRESTEDRLLLSNARRLAIKHRVRRTDTPQDNARARSLFAFGCILSPSVVHLQSFKLLRVLNLEGCSMDHFNEHVGYLLHLRYLGICDVANEKFVLPEEMGSLKFLQVLYLRGIDGELPLSVGTLTQLMCLRARWRSSSRKLLLPGGKLLKNLISLQELHIDARDGIHRGQFVRDLGKLRELRELRTTIENLDWRMQSDLMKSLGSLDQMQCLEISGSWATPINSNAAWDLYMNYEAWDGRLPTGLRKLFLHDLCFSRLPACIDPSCLSNLSQLSLSVSYLDDQGLKILGALPQLSFLELSANDGTDHGGWATLTGTATDGYFQKLRTCILHKQMVQFLANEEDSSVSFTIWRQGKFINGTPPTFDSKRKQVNCRIVGPIMPNLERLHFYVVASELRTYHNSSCDNLGMDCLASLRNVQVGVDCVGADDADMDKVLDALDHAIEVHPNRPALKTIGYI